MNIDVWPLDKLAMSFARAVTEGSLELPTSIMDGVWLFLRAEVIVEA